MKAVILMFFAMSFLSGCQQIKQKKKQVSIYFDTSSNPDIKKYHIVLNLNNRLLLDTLMGRDDVFNYKLLKSFAIQANKKNELKIKINYKSVGLSLGGINQDTIYVLPTYSRNKVREMFDNNVKGKALTFNDYMSFLDTLNKQYNIYILGEMDSLSLEVLKSQPK